MVYQNHSSSISFIHHVIKLSTLCLITGFTSACSCFNRVCDSLCSGCRVVARGALCQLGQPVGEQGESSWEGLTDQLDTPTDTTWITLTKLVVCFLSRFFCPLQEKGSLFGGLLRKTPKTSGEVPPLKHKYYVWTECHTCSGSVALQFPSCTHTFFCWPWFIQPLMNSVWNRFFFYNVCWSEWGLLYSYIRQASSGTLILIWLNCLDQHSDLLIMRLLEKDVFVVVSF